MAISIKAIREALGHSVETVGRQKDGTYIVRRGYFYRNGLTNDKFGESINAKLVAAGLNAKVIEAGDRWAPFRGGASVAKNSHFYAVIADV